MKRPTRSVGGSETAEICPEIGSHKRCVLCDLSGTPLRDFDAISLTGFYPQGAKLKGANLLIKSKSALEEMVNP